MTTERWRQLMRLIEEDDVNLMVEACENLQKEANVEDIPRLIELLGHDDFVVREAAAWPLANLGATSFFKELFLAYQRGFDEGYDNDGFSTALIELVELHPASSRKSLIDLQSASDPVLKRYSTWLLTEFIEPSLLATEPQ